MYNGGVSQPLAKVLDDETLAGARGPDGIHEIVVPGDWLDERLRVDVTLPRLLRCAACQGGGCDRCERQGAVTSRERGAPVEVVNVQLPPTPATVRVPRHGGLLSGQPRGHLLLQVRTGEQPSDGLTCERPAPVVVAPAAMSARPPALLITIGAVALAVLAWMVSR